MSSAEPVSRVAGAALTQGLFPSEVLTAVSATTKGPQDLLPLERALVSRAVPSRQREFATGRACARSLLGQLGIPEGPLLRRVDRTPVWPDGVVGSISHTRDVCVAAVARQRDIAGIGVDVEDDARIAPELVELICTDAERDWIGHQRESQRDRLAVAFFSAKESVYKCLYPRGLNLEFHDVELELELSAGRFGARAPKAERFVAGHLLTGSVVSRRGWILTGATLRVRGPRDKATEGETAPAQEAESREVRP